MACDTAKTGYRIAFGEGYIMPINKNELSKEQIMKAMQYKTADELMAYAKAEGIDITKQEAEAYLAELSEFELKDGEVRRVAGGFCGNDLECPSFCKDYSAPY
jgi:hypothetical protein